MDACGGDNGAVRVVDGVEYGLCTRTVCGLYSLTACGVATTPTDDPRVVLLKRLAATTPCSAHVDGRAAYGWEPGDMWGLPGPGNRYVPTHIGLLQSRFFEQDVVDSAFYPNGRALMRRLDGHEDWSQAILCDAIALLVAASLRTVRSCASSSCTRSPGTRRG